MNAKHDLAEALCQLLETKTLEKITVKDIVARCGVNRQTFYYHFHDVYDLMRWIFEREAANLAQTVREAGGDWRQELHTITDVLRSKRHLVMNAYRSVNRRDLERYLMQGYGPVIRRIVDQAAVGLDVGQEDLEFVSRFYARGLLSGVFDWIESGMPENIGDDLRRCILLLDGSPEAQAKKADLWKYLKENTKPDVYRAIRYGFGGITNLNFPKGDAIVVGCYRIAQKIFKFN